ncbi:MAG TPA: hypothetical protein VG816_01810, partial [Solirubrobacterales bacterium]|nr:hypothetical protein [Solirubrobacterales bacterium]
MRRLFTVLALGAATIIPAVPAVAAEAGAPAWTISAIPYPTAFEAGTNDFESGENGPGYQLQAFNVGGGPTMSGFTIVDTLPGPLTPSATRQPEGKYGPEGEKQKLNCSVAGHTVTCVGGQVVPLLPGEEASVIVPLEVAANAPAQVLNKVRVEGGGAALVTSTAPTPVRSEPSPFSFLSGSSGLYGSRTNVDGSTATQAGSHPYQETVAGFNLTTNANPNAPDNNSLLAAGGGLREVKVELPKGDVINPSATPHCTESQLQSGEVGCPDATQIGTVALTLSIARGFSAPATIRPLYNMVAPPGHPAEFAFDIVEGIYVHILGSVRSDGTFALGAKSSNILAIKTIGGVRTVLWGDPTAESHDSQRGVCAFNGVPGGACPTERTHKAFVTMPSACGDPLITTVHVDSWLEPGSFISRSYESSDLNGGPVGVDGCNQLQFEPTIESRPTTNLADSPSGLDFNLHQPQNEEFEGLATANLKDITVALPQGIALNPSAGAGRDACSSSQVGLATAVGETPIRFSEEGASCPDAAKIGSVEVKTPLLEDPLQGNVYLAKPFDNPFGTLLGIYLVVDDPQTGVMAKLPGKVEADPATGQLTTTFTESPELPLEDVTLHLFNGPRAALTTPQTCGAYTTTASLTPWSTPEGATVGKQDSFETTTSPNGGICPRNGGEAPNKPAFTAGTIAPQAGAYSPF